LADEAAADEQLVRGGLGVGRRLAQRREEELGLPGDHRDERLVKPAGPGLSRARTTSPEQVAQSH
jgi:hypothetical protein